MLTSIRPKFSPAVCNSAHPARSLVYAVNATVDTWPVARYQSILDVIICVRAASHLAKRSFRSGGTVWSFSGRRSLRGGGGSLRRRYVRNESALCCPAVRIAIERVMPAMVSRRGDPHGSQCVQS